MGTYWHRFVGVDAAHKNVFFIGRLDKCDDSSALFLSLLERILVETEGKIRLVFTTTSGRSGYVTARLSRFPAKSWEELRIENDALVAPPGEQTHLDLSDLRALEQRQNIQGLRSRIKNRGCGICLWTRSHPEREVLLLWLTNTRTPWPTVEIHLTALKKPILSQVLYCILIDMPEERRSWAKKVLAWVLFSVRALQIENLCFISRLIRPTKERHTEWDILGWLGGLLAVRHGEVHFAHFRIRPWLNTAVDQPGNREWWQYDPAHDGHFDIVRTCLTYLKSREHSEPQQGHIREPTRPVRHELPYDFQYWTLHYREVQQVEEGLLSITRDEAMGIFREGSIFKRWIQKFAETCDPFTSPKPENWRPLPISSYFGLDDIVMIFSREAPDDCMSALVEAARRGSISTVRTLKALHSREVNPAGGRRTTRPALGSIVLWERGCPLRSNGPPDSF